MREEEDIYQELVRITSDYLGPAAPRFIDRHIKSHLEKEPSEITEDDIEKLVTWVRPSLSLLTTNQKMIDECVTRFLSTANKGANKASNL